MNAKQKHPAEFGTVFCPSCAVDQTQVMTQDGWRCVICQNEIDLTCPTCAGMGWIDIGDCEDGVTDTCPECLGAGRIEQ
jgi:DnaJ-class molecular chaperone